jgi:hypothetical protein
MLLIICMFDSFHRTIMTQGELEAGGERSEGAGLVQASSRRIGDTFCSDKLEEALSMLVALAALRCRA